MTVDIRFSKTPPSSRRFMKFYEVWENSLYWLTHLFYKQPHFRVEPRVAFKIPKMRLRVGDVILILPGKPGRYCPFIL